MGGQQAVIQVAEGGAAVEDERATRIRRARELMARKAQGGGAQKAGGLAAIKSSSATPQQSQRAPAPGAASKGEFRLLVQLPADMRPSLELNTRSRVPTSVRQLYLSRWVEHFLQAARPPTICRNPACERAVEEAVAAEREIFGRAGNKSVYISMSAKAQAAARQKVLADRRARLAARADGPGNHEKAGAAGASEARPEDASWQPNGGDSCRAERDEEGEDAAVTRALRATGLIPPSPSRSPSLERAEGSDSPSPLPLPGIDGVIQVTGGASAGAGPGAGQVAPVGEELPQMPRPPESHVAESEGAGEQRSLLREGEREASKECAQEEEEEVRKHQTSPRATTASAPSCLQQQQQQAGLAATEEGEAVSSLHGSISDRPPPPLPPSLGAEVEPTPPASSADVAACQPLPVLAASKDAIWDQEACRAPPGGASDGRHGGQGHQAPPAEDEQRQAPATCPSQTEPIPSSAARALLHSASPGDASARGLAPAAAATSSAAAAAPAASAAAAAAAATATTAAGGIQHPANLTSLTKAAAEEVGAEAGRGRPLERREREGSADSLEELLQEGRFVSMDGRIDPTRRDWLPDAAPTERHVSSLPAPCRLPAGPRAGNGGGGQMAGAEGLPVRQGSIRKEERDGGRMGRVQAWVDEEANGGTPPDVVNSKVHGQVEGYVKEHLRPLCKSGVISGGQYRWATEKTTAKVMQHHCAETTAEFLIREGGKVKKLAEGYLRAYAKSAQSWH
eukprot:jgi/Mesen1/6438/ME000033S05730